ncbi:MAG TPA: ankyrin repeat domain-containing protein, partial [Gammaproteobacteria bacterium]|nr:ankyrin repeat domain-containing protein [Gammaproteobacteria bacterium]
MVRLNPLLDDARNNDVETIAAITAWLQQNGISSFAADEPHFEFSAEGYQTTTYHQRHFGSVNDAGECVLHVALSQGYFETFDALVRLYDHLGQSLNEPNNSGDAPLHLLIKKSKQSNETRLEHIVSLIGKLRSRKANLNLANSEGDTPLTLLAANPALSQAARTLIGHVDVDTLTTKNKQGNSALHIAITNNNTELALALVANLSSEQLHEKNHVGKRAFDLAKEQNNNEVAIAIVGRSLPEQLNQKNKKGETELHQAIRAGNASLALALIERGADIEVENPIGQRAIHLAVLWNRPLIVNRLIEKNCDISATDSKNRTPAHYGCKYGDENFFIQTREKRLNLNSTDTVHGWTPIYYAAKYGHENIIRLISAKCAKKTKDKIDFTPLHVATVFRQLKAATALIECGWNIDARDTLSAPTLHWVSWCGYPEFVDVFCRLGANLELKQKHGLLALSLLLGAVVYHKNQTKGLLTGQIFATSVNNTIFWDAKNFSYGPFVKAIYDYALDESGLREQKLKDKKELPKILLHAAKTRDAVYAKIALNAEANVNATDSNKRTMLHHASINGDQVMCMLALTSGADCSLTDKRGCTARDLAIQHRHADIVELLDRFKRNPNTFAQDREISACLSSINAGETANFHENRFAETAKAFRCQLHDARVAAITMGDTAQLLELSQSRNAVDKLYAQAIELTGAITLQQLITDAQNGRKNCWTIHILAEMNKPEMLFPVVERMKKEQYDLHNPRKTERITDPTPLEIATKKGYVGFVFALAQCGYDLRHLNTGNHSALYFATIGNHEPLMAFLLGCGLTLTELERADSKIAEQVNSLAVRLAQQCSDPSEKNSSKTLTPIHDAIARA